MTESLPGAIERLRSLSPQLNKVTDEASAVVRMVESFLAECSLGIAGSVPLYDSIDGNEVRLAYNRHGQKFRLTIQHWKSVRDSQGKLVMNVYTEEPDSELAEETPWPEAPRSLRLRAISKLPDLLKALADSAQRLIKETQEATHAARELMAAMKPPQGGRGSGGAGSGGSTGGAAASDALQDATGLALAGSFALIPLVVRRSSRRRDERCRLKPWFARIGCPGGGRRCSWHFDSLTIRRCASHARPSRAPRVNRFHSRSRNRTPPATG